MPGCGKRGGIQAHHIKRWASNPSLRFDVNNGITLCKTCHGSIWQKEEQYEALFASILMAKMGKNLTVEVIKIMYGK